MPPPNTTYKTFILADERFTVGDAVMVKVTDCPASRARLRHLLAGMSTPSFIKPGPLNHPLIPRADTHIPSAALSVVPSIAE